MSGKPLAQFAVVGLLAGAAASVAYSQTGGSLDQRPGSALEQDRPAAVRSVAMRNGAPFAIPEPLEAEHHELYTELEAATRSGGRTGKAAQSAFDALRDHFEKEERYALPQLGALATLAGMPGRESAELTSEQRKDLAARTERFQAELPQMLKEHKAISAALEELQTVARSEDRRQVARLAQRIMEHAETEEQVLYPAALLAGQLVRATGSRPR